MTDALTGLIPGLVGRHDAVGAGHGAQPGDAPAAHPGPGDAPVTSAPTTGPDTPPVPDDPTAEPSSPTAPVAKPAPRPTVGGRPLVAPAGPLRPPAPKSKPMVVPEGGEVKAPLTLPVRFQYGAARSAPSLVPGSGPAQAPSQPLPEPVAPDAARTQAQVHEQAPAVYEPARRVLRILPLGAGLALVGLGLGFLGLRLRRG